ncbi:MAG: hypothetical protein V1778_02370 [bacterium]
MDQPQDQVPVPDQKQVALPFNIVIYVLFSIVVACGIFIGLSMKQIAPLPGGLALLVWVALPHTVGMFLSIRHKHTEAAIVIALFLGFWLYLGSGLLFIEPSVLQHALKFIEPPIFLSIIVLTSFYGRIDRSLQAILGGLGATVFFLWLTKIWESLGAAIPIVVGALGLWALGEAAYLLNRHQPARHQPVP